MASLAWPWCVYALHRMPTLLHDDGMVPVPNQTAPAFFANAATTCSLPEASRPSAHNSNHRLSCHFLCGEWSLMIGNDCFQVCYFQ